MLSVCHGVLCCAAGTTLGVPSGAAPAGMVTLQLSLHPLLGGPLDDTMLQARGVGGGTGMGS